jgi:outer membrane receptor protein involved in Fe transport
MKKIVLTSMLCAGFTYADIAQLLDEEKRTFDNSKYIPDISLITDVSYVNNSINDDEMAHLGLPGIAHGLYAEHNHGDSNAATYNAKQGFNFNYAELILSSSVDPFFSMDATFHFSEHGVEVEEAYFTTTALGYGLRFRGGKLLSNFGYINAQHQHYWDFGDMPLVYEAFLGTHGIDELGAQLQWTAPTPFYLMAGFEVLQGGNEQMFGNETVELEDVWTSVGEDYIDGTTAPSLYVGYVKSSFDIGETAILSGLSYAQGDSLIDHSEDEEDPHVFKGDAKLYGADLVVLHAIDSYRSLKWQSEWLSRDLDGIEYTPMDSANINKKQSGLYSQLIYTHDKNWRMGVRYDTIYKNDITKDGVDVDMPDDFNKYSAMIEYHTSEFARFRLQYNRNEAMYDEDGLRQNLDKVILEANIAIGAHAAHAF